MRMGRVEGIHLSLSDRQWGERSVFSGSWFFATIVEAPAVDGSHHRWSDLPWAAFSVAQTLVVPFFVRVKSARDTYNIVYLGIVS